MDFETGKKWPVLFLFDPAARGALAVEAFQGAAETYGWILVGSNNSKNGPLDVSVRAAQMIWSECRKRFPLDERQIYAAGFSGGARMASLFPRIIKQGIAGILGCGAGLNTAIKPEEIKPAFYFGLVGLADFNYGEMKLLDAAFDGAGVSHRLLIYEGDHTWPDPAFCARAVGRLEVEAMRQGLNAVDEAEIDALAAKEAADAKALEDSGRIYWAVARYEALKDLRSRSVDIASLENKIKALKGRKEYSRFLKEEKARDRRALEIQSDFLRAFMTIQQSPAPPNELPVVLKDLKLRLLKREAKKGKTVEARSFASRLLSDLYMKARATADTYYEKKDMATTTALLELALEACEEKSRREKYVHFDLACVAAETGNSKKALKYLGSAVDTGFSDIQALETVKAFDAIRETPEYRNILARIKK